MEFLLFLAGFEVNWGGGEQIPHVIYYSPKANTCLIVINTQHVWSNFHSNFTNTFYSLSSINKEYVMTCVTVETGGDYLGYKIRGGHPSNVCTHYREAASE